MLHVAFAVALCSVSISLSGCGTASTTTTAPITTTSTTTRAGAQPGASLGTNLVGRPGRPSSLLELQSGTLVAGYQCSATLDVPNDCIMLFDHELWEDALEKNLTDVACSATLDLPGTSAGDVVLHALQELQGGILAAGAFTVQSDLESYGIYLFESTVIEDAVTNGRTNVRAAASLAVSGAVTAGRASLYVFAMQELEGGHLAVAVESDTEGKVLLFHREQIAEAIADGRNDVEATASLAGGWEVGSRSAHALEQLQGGHLALGVEGAVQLFDHALIEDALTNNRMNVLASASLAGPTSDTVTSALEELQGGHLAVGTGFLEASSSGILLFERSVIEGALANNLTGVKGTASLACGSSDGTCSFYALQQLQSGDLAAADFSRGVLLFSNASIEDALVNSQTDVAAGGMLAGDSIVALEELQWMGQGNNLAVVTSGSSFPVFSNSIIEDAFVQNQPDDSAIWY